MKTIKVVTDMFFMGKHEASDLNNFLSKVPDDSKIFFITGTGKDLLLKKDGEILETSTEDWMQFWDDAWVKVAGSIEKGRKKYFNDLPDSYFDQVIYNYSKK